MTDTNPTKGQIAAYLRVSTKEQNLDRQDQLREGADRVFEEKASGGSMNRPALRELMDWARDGDLVKVWSIDRLARSLPDLHSIVTEITAKGCAVQFVQENLTFDPRKKNTAMETLMFQMLGAFAEFERNVSKARQAEGIAKAKAKGVYKGRKTVIDNEVVVRARELVALGVSKAEIARQLSVSRSTIYKALNGEGPGAA